MKDYHLTYNADGGYFDVHFFHKQILGSRIKACVGKHDAIPIKVKHFEGKDQFGSHTCYRIIYQSDANEKRQFTGVIKAYADCIVFEIINHYKIKGKGKKSVFEHPYIAFPNFEGESWEANLNILSYKRQVAFNYPLMWQGRVVQPMRDGKHTPLIITNDQFETLVLSPLNHLLHGTVSISSFPPEVKCGLPRAVNLIEKETVYQTVLVLGHGVNRTLQRWGDLLHTVHKTHRMPMDSDVQLTHLSYWTNAGASYWYHTHRKESYEQTLTALKAHHDRIGIAFGSYQLDSWWYQKEGDHYTAGIVDWAPKESTLSKNFNAMLPIFQKYKRLKLFSETRISHVQTILAKPLGCHFKQLANDAVYVKACPDDFTLDTFALPKTAQAAKKLFLQIFEHPKWRLSFVIHDWLQYMNDHHRAFRDMQMAEDYFIGLDEACLAIAAPDNRTGHLTLQLCMTQPHMTLNSVTMQSVTTLRSTSDSASFLIEGTNRWWWHLYASPLIHALGKYPFYDNRLSGSSHTHPFSSDAKFEFIWLGLSCGPIGIGDEIGKENVALIRRVALRDGEIVKPDVPCRPLDKCFCYNPRLLQNDRGVAVYSYSKVDSAAAYPIYYMLVFNVHPFGRKVRMTVALTEIAEIDSAQPEAPYYVYDYFKKRGCIVNAGTAQVYAMARRKFFYHIIAPIVEGAAMIGDTAMHITGSRQLITGIDIRKDRVIFQCIRDKHPGISVITLYLSEMPQEVLLENTRIAFEWRAGLLKFEIGATLSAAEIVILR